jgi:hypothetical protein
MHPRREDRRKELKDVTKVTPKMSPVSELGRNNEAEKGKEERYLKDDYRENKMDEAAAT